MSGDKEKQDVQRRDEQGLWPLGGRRGGGHREAAGSGPGLLPVSGPGSRERGQDKGGVAEQSSPGLPPSLRASHQQ